MFQYDIDEVNLDGFDYIIQRQLKPEARRDVVGILKELKVTPTSMIDISDGLASEILHLCKSSNVGCHVYGEKIPMDTQTVQTSIDFNIDPTTAALNGGEDYELLFTIQMEDFDKIKANPNFTVIAHITQESEGIHLMTGANTKIPLKARSWDAMTEE